MITLETLNKAVCGLYQQALDAAATGAALSAEDVRSPIKRPSGKVELDDSSDGKLMAAGRERSVTFRLYYFATSGHAPKLENLAVRSAIGAAFLGGVPVGDTYFYLDNGVSFTVTDGVLVATIELDLVDGIEDAPGETMETLTLNTEVQT